MAAEIGALRFSSADANAIQQPQNAISAVVRKLKCMLNVMMLTVLFTHFAYGMLVFEDCVPIGLCFGGKTCSFPELEA